MPAKKQFGQNFLQNKKKLLKIVAALDMSLSVVIEIGPGHGELTQHLLQAGFSVICIEKDRDLIAPLESKFSQEISSHKLRVVCGDALTELSGFITEHVSPRQSYAVVGNIPYYITGHLLRIIEGLSWHPQQTIFLVQEEVARRVCSQKGSMNILAASVGIWADAQLITLVPRTMFSPQPRVDSAVILLTTHVRGHSPAQRDRYFRCVHALFKQPRRTIVKNLVDAGVARSVIEETLTKISLPFTARPQNVSIEDILVCSALFS